jgi:DHA1 family bicyclomycin/chloramphenicol resistance-like MFS transporter
MSKSTFDRLDTLILLGGITALTAISIDMFLPALGVIARDFDIPLNRSAALTGAYFLAFAIGQLFWGLFSDAFGRRLALRISLSGFLLASGACALAPSFTILLAARFAQGLMGGAPVIVRAMVRDVSSGKRAAALMTILAAVLSIGSLLAPVIGSGLLVLFSWRALFVTLIVLVSAFLVLITFAVEETLEKPRPERFSLGFLLQSIRFLFTSRAFLAPTLTGSLSVGGFSSIGAIGAITVEAQYGVAPESFGALFAIGAIFGTAGMLTVGRLLKTKSIVFVASLSLALLSVAVVFHLALLTFSPSLPVFWAGVCLYILAFGMIFPPAVAAAVEPAPEMPGFATAVMGAAQMICAAVAAAVASSLYDGTPAAISTTLVIFGTLSVTAFVIGRLRA